MFPKPSDCPQLLAATLVVPDWIGGLVTQRFNPKLGLIVTLVFKIAGRQNVGPISLGASEAISELHVITNVQEIIYALPRLFTVRLFPP